MASGRVHYSSRDFRERGKCGRDLAGKKDLTSLLGSGLR